MKIESGKNVESLVIGEVEEQSFDVVWNTKMAEILSSGIYSNNILAPIRELICNAHDAHVEAKQKRRFVVHVPSYIDNECYFAVRDYGNGLTEDEVDKIYRKYGASTKTDTNTAIGCLGLGSKSPFAYTDHFDVYVFKDGKKSIYNCSKNSGDFPTITLFDIVDTDEPNGVLVQFDVKSGDVSEFKSAIRRMCFFKEEMELTGDKIDLLDVPETVHGIYPFSFSNAFGSGYSVEMGGVMYSFRIGDCPHDSFLTDFENRRRYNDHIIIHVEIGDVDIAVSRESVKLTTKSVEAIKRGLSRFYYGVNEEFMRDYRAAKKLVDKSACVRDWQTRYNEFIDCRRFNSIMERLFRNNWIRKNIKELTGADKKCSPLSRRLYINIRDINEYVAKSVFIDASAKGVVPWYVKEAAKGSNIPFRPVMTTQAVAAMRRAGIVVHSMDEWKKERINVPRSGISRSSQPRAKSLRDVGWGELKVDCFYLNGVERSELRKRVVEALERGATVAYVRLSPNTNLPVDAGESLDRVITNKKVKSLFVNPFAALGGGYLPDLREFINSGVPIVGVPDSVYDKIKGDSQFIDLNALIVKALNDPKLVLPYASARVVGNTFRRTKIHRFGQAYGKELITFICKIARLPYDHTYEYVFHLPYDKFSGGGDDDVDIKTRLARLTITDVFEHFYAYGSSKLIELIERVVRDAVPLFDYMSSDCAEWAFDYNGALATKVRESSADAVQDYLDLLNKCMKRWRKRKDAVDYLPKDAFAYDSEETNAAD